MAKKTEKRSVYIYSCRRTCFFLGKRWLAGSTYKFTRELTGVMASHFDPIEEVKQDIVPSDELEYDVVGRERNRPSEYAAEV